MATPTDVTNTQKLMKILLSKKRDVKDEVVLFDGILSELTPSGQFIGWNELKKCFTAEQLERFISLVFQRRFGWSEIEHLRCTHVKVKSDINEVLTKIIEVFKSIPPCVELLNSLKFAIIEANNFPVIRNQLVCHTLDWLRHNQWHQQSFHLVQSIILLGLGDVWSAIRSATASRSIFVIPEFSAYQLEHFYKELTVILRNEQSSWQKLEGALMGVHAVLRCFQWIEEMPTEMDNPSELAEETEQQTENLATREHKQMETCFFVKFGSQRFSAVPGFIGERLQSLVFSLLQHAQLSVRENAVKAFSAFLSRSDFKVAWQVFQDVMLKLRSSADEEQPQSCVYRKDFHFMNAFEAEGLLGVMTFLVKRIPPGYLLPRWPQHFSTLSLFLMHPASTVRQATSLIFKFLVAKDSHNPVLLKLVLQNISDEWIVPLPALRSALSVAAAAASAPGSTSYRRRTSVTKLADRCNQAGPTVLQYSDAWQWREGRLLAYELICQFVIKNHWLYMFGLQNFDNFPSDADATGGEELISTPRSKSLKLKRGLQRTNSDRRPSVAVRPTNQMKQRRTSCARQASQKKRLATSSSDASLPSLNALVRHYASQSRRASRLAAPKVAAHLQATSLLVHTRRLDVTHRKGGVDSPRSKSCGQNGQDGLRTLLESGDHEAEDADWVADLELKDMDELLRTILYQTIECLADPRWELRRMAQQLMPCLVELIRWYDMQLLQHLWEDHMTEQLSLLCIGACIAFNDSVSHAASLQKLLQDPPQSWQDVESCKRVVRLVTEGLNVQLPFLCQVAAKLLSQHQQVDRLSITLAEALLTAHAHFQITTEQRRQQCGVLVNLLVATFLVAHPNDPIVSMLRPHLNPWTFSTPTAGFLSCITLNGSPQQLALQVEKLMLSHIHHSLAEFLKKSIASVVTVLMPLLVRLMIIYERDDALHRSFFQALLSFGRAINSSKSMKLIHESGASRRLIDLGMEDLTANVKDKTLCHSLIKCNLDIFLEFVDAKQHFVPAILSNISFRLSSMKSISPDDFCADDSDLMIMSNDVPDLIVTQQMESSEDEEDNVFEGSQGKVICESQALAVVSSNSERKISISSSCRRTTSSTSDWSDDEEEDNTAYFEIFKDFVKKLKGKVDLSQSVKKLKTNEKLLIESLLR